jgi:uncharacterized protein (DUF3084 family)
MTFYTLFALILLPVLGGLIAWAGDVIGYRLGKSRRSLLGMRPRLTARVVGVVVGVLLVWFTLGIAAIGSSSVRDALFSLAALRAEATSLGRQNAELLQRVQQATAKANAADARSRDLNTQVSTTTQSLTRANSQLEAQRGKLQSAQAQVTSARAEAGRLAKQSAALKTRVAQTASTLSHTLGNLTTAERKLGKAQADLGAAERVNAGLLQRNGQLSAEQKVLQNTNRDLTQQNTQLSQTSAALSKQQEDLTRHVGELQQVIQTYKDQTLVAQSEKEQAEAQLKLAKAETARYVALSRTLYAWRIASAAAPVMYEPGEEIVSSVLSTNQTQEQIEASLKELLHLAGSLAGARGAAVGENGRAVRVEAPVPPTTQPDEEVPEQQIIAEVARRIRLNSAQDYVVSIRSLRRVFEGEGTQVQVELWGSPNSRLFRQNDLIATDNVNGAGTRGEILRSLFAFIQSVRNVLGRQGVRPDPKTGQLLTIPAEDILTALDAISAAHAGRKVVAMAGADVYKVMPNSEGASVRLKVADASEGAPATKKEDGGAGQPNDTGRGPGPLEMRVGRLGSGRTGRGA